MSIHFPFCRPLSFISCPVCVHSCRLLRKHSGSFNYYYYHNWIRRKPTVRWWIGPLFLRASTKCQAEIEAEPFWWTVNNQPSEWEETAHGPWPVTSQPGRRSTRLDVSTLDHSDLTFLWGVVFVFVHLRGRHRPVYCLCGSVWTCSADAVMFNWMPLVLASTEALTVL